MRTQSAGRSSNSQQDRRRLTIVSRHFGSVFGSLVLVVNLYNVCVLMFVKYRETEYRLPCQYLSLMFLVARLSLSRAATDSPIVPFVVSLSHRLTYRIINFLVSIIFGINFVITFFDYVVCRTVYFDVSFSRDYGFRKFVRLRENRVSRKRFTIATFIL